MLSDAGATLILAALLGLIAGGVIAALWRQRHVNRLQLDLAEARARVRAQDDIERERATATERLTLSFEAMAGRSMREHAETFLRIAEERLGRHHERAGHELGDRQRAIEQMLKPIGEALSKTEQQIRLIEKERREAFGSMAEQLRGMNAAQQALQSETRHLVNALRRPEVRGRWGELTLRRVVELAGMTEHCDFEEQAHRSSSEGAVRPDMVVHLPEQRDIVVDAKTPLDAYLEAVEAAEPGTREAALARHARNVRDHVRELSGKAYWSQFPRSPEFVILFLPGEQFLAAALDKEPALQEEALRQKVFLTTPTSLVGLLKVVAYGWRQIALAENAERIRDLGEELHRRLTTFTAHLAKLGRSLSGSVDAFNSAVGSLERQVLPAARRFGEMGIQTHRALDTLETVTRTTRSLPSQADDSEG